MFLQSQFMQEERIVGYDLMKFSQIGEGVIMQTECCKALVS
jgi:hypothetical protein